MSPPRVRPAVEPRVYGAREMAILLNRGVTWFYSNRTKLEEQGMPAFDLLLDGWDSKAVHLWLDRRSGLFSDCVESRGEGADVWLRAADG